MIIWQRLKAWWVRAWCGHDWVAIVTREADKELVRQFGVNSSLHDYGCVKCGKIDLDLQAAITKAQIRSVQVQAILPAIASARDGPTDGEPGQLSITSGTGELSLTDGSGI